MIDDLLKLRLRTPDLVARQQPFTPGDPSIENVAIIGGKMLGAALQRQLSTLSPSAVRPHLRISRTSHMLMDETAARMPSWFNMT